MSNVNKDLCISCGLCVSMHSDLFGFDPDGKAQPTKQPENPAELAAVKDAETNCPATAISAEAEVIQMDTSSAMAA